MAQNFLSKTLQTAFGKKSWDGESGAHTNLTFGDLALYASGGLGEIYDQQRYPIWNFPTIARFAFEQNTVVYKCVMLRASALAGLTWNLYSWVDGKRVEVDDRSHPLLKLLNTPNPAQSRSGFLHHVEASKLLDGNVFIHMDGSAAKSNFRGKPPTQLWSLRPDWVTVIAGASYTRLPYAYSYSPGGVNQGQNQTFTVDPITGESNIIHIVSYSPLYEETMMRGLSPVRSAIYQILTHNSGQKWNFNLLRNSARPSGAFTTDGGFDDQSELTTDQLQELRRALAEVYGSPENAGRPLVLAGGLKWQEMSKSPQDMDFVRLKDSAARDIANILGVPAQLLGIPGDNTYSNYQEARASFFEDTVIPSAKQLRDELNRRLVPYFGDNLWLDIDIDDISALSVKRDNRMKTISEAAFLTINEKRNALGYDEIENGDEIILPSMMTTLTATAKPIQPPEDEVIVPDDIPSTE